MSPHQDARNQQHQQQHQEASQKEIKEQQDHQTMEMKKLLSIFFLLSTILCLFTGNASAGGVFNVLSYGAKADGKTENSKVCILLFL